MMAERDERSNLVPLAEALHSASEKLWAGESLAEAEVRTLQSLRAALPAEPRHHGARWALPAAAAAVLVFGIAAGVLVLRPRGGGLASIDLAMADIEGTRSGGAWRPGARFVLTASLSEDAYLHIVHLDAEKKLELVFPLHDSQAKAWSCLGHASNRLPGKTVTSIPTADFPMSLQIEGLAEGEEAFLAFATREKVGEAQLLELRDELRRAVEAERGKGAEVGAIVERLRDVIARKHAAAQALVRYEVK